MNMRILGVTTAVLAVAFTSSMAMAQGQAATCAALNAMDATGQQSYLLGYMAGQNDAMMMGGGMDAMATGGAMATDAPAADATATGDAAAPAADAAAPAADANATATGGAMATSGMAMMDPQAMIDACKSTPDATLSDAMGTMKTM